MEHTQHFHFIGIGGIGMSGLALVLKQQGNIISGSDCNLKQKSILQLQQAGCIIYDGHDASNLLPSVTSVVYTAAVDYSNPELIAAKKHNLRLISRAQLLAEVLNSAYGISIAGAHGKTTTSALIAHILVQANKNPTYIIGGFLHNYDTNAHAGTGSYVVAETCESDKTTQLVKAHIAVITNIDYEHLDIYANLDEIKKIFTEFVFNVHESGLIVACIDNNHVRDLLNQIRHSLKASIITYGFSQDAQVRIAEHSLEAEQSTATLVTDGTIIGTYMLALPGTYNLLNSVAAYAATQVLGVSFEEFKKACANFKGVDRRFTFKGIYKGATLFDDYGHHPNEIKEVLPVAWRKAQEQKGRLIVAFQPHRFSRTDLLWNDFINVFTQQPFDMLFVSDIYGAFEPPRPGITGERLAHEIIQRNPNKHVAYAPEQNHFEAVKKNLEYLVESNDVVLFLGAGKINMVIDQLV